MGIVNRLFNWGLDSGGYLEQNQVSLAAAAKRNLDAGNIDLRTYNETLSQIESTTIAYAESDATNNLGPDPAQTFWTEAGTAARNLPANIGGGAGKIVGGITGNFLSNIPANVWIVAIVGTIIFFVYLFGSKRS